MASTTTTGRTVAMLVTDGFEQVELTEPMTALEGAGVTVRIVSPKSKLDGVVAWRLTDWGDAFAVDVELDEARSENFHCLVLPGGVMNPDSLRTDQRAVGLVREFFREAKPVAAICHGPWMLVEADVVQGRRLTSYPSLRTDLINAGAEWVDEEVVVDGNLVTSRKPDDIPAFNRALIELLTADEPGAAPTRARRTG